MHQFVGCQPPITQEEEQRVAVTSRSSVLYVTSRSSVCFICVFADTTRIVCSGIVEATVVRLRPTSN